MCFKPHDRLLLAICLCGALACAAIASSPELRPRGAPISDGKLAIVRGSDKTATQPTYCDELLVNNGGARGGHRGCINQPEGTICIRCAVTANSPTNIGGVGPLITGAQVNCNIGQQDQMFGKCDGNVSCVKLSPTGAKCTGNIGGNTPE